MGFSSILEKPPFCPRLQSLLQKISRQSRPSESNPLHSSTGKAMIILATIPCWEIQQQSTSSPQRVRDDSIIVVVCYNSACAAFTDQSLLSMFAQVDQIVARPGKTTVALYRNSYMLDDPATRFAKGEPHFPQNERETEAEATQAFD